MYTKMLAFLEYKGNLCHDPPPLEGVGKTHMGDTQAFWAECVLFIPTHSSIPITLKSLASQGSVPLQTYGRSSCYYDCQLARKDKKALTKCDFLQLELNLALSNQHLLGSLPSEHVSADRKTKGGNQDSSDGISLW